jgi:hypothetical protein
MVVLIPSVILAGMAIMQEMGAQSMAVPVGPSVASVTARDARDSIDIPPLPTGTSTIFGGDIRDLDPVRDQFTLRIAGQRPMKVLFDERTQVYRDGKRVSLRDLQSGEHVSVETSLDGAKVFAISIHMLSNPRQGEYEGRVLGFDRSTGELTVASGLSLEKIRVLVQGSTTLERKGQNARSGPAIAADLVDGTLVSIEFRPGNRDEPIASRVSILAVPGASFVFSGNIASLDIPAGFFVVVDPRDRKSYKVYFSSATSSAAQNLHLGDYVRAVASYDGAQYVARSIQTTDNKAK